MRRADRLFRLIQTLRRRRTPVTAATLAEALEVSLRTVYRDVRDLQASGTPIDGEAGVGYRLRAGYDLPPLMFDRDEIQALVLGARLVERLGDPSLARAAGAVLAKVRAVLPGEMDSVLGATALYVPATRTLPGTHLEAVREALLSRSRLQLDYENERGEATNRVVRPLGAFFWGRSWTLGAFCELRQDFRTFRFDRIRSIERGEPFAEEAGRTLRDYLARAGEGALALLG